jgi:hypothetical protein
VAAVALRAARAAPTLSNRQLFDLDHISAARTACGQHPFAASIRADGASASLPNGKKDAVCEEGAVATENFVREQAVPGFSQLLEAEQAAGVRERLRSLPIGEENKFSVTAERLGQADRRIAACESRIQRQYGVIEKLKADGFDTEAAERLLRNFMEMHDLYASHRLFLVEGPGRRGL